MQFRGPQDLLAASLDDLAIRTMAPVIQEEVVTRVRGAKALFSRAVESRFSTGFARLRGYLQLTKEEEDLWFTLTLVCCIVFLFLVFVGVCWCFLFCLFSFF